MNQSHCPPKLFFRFFRWFCHPKLRDHIEGDLLETYNAQLTTLGKKKADLKFIIDVLLLFRPGIIKPLKGYRHLNNYGMIKSYLKIGWRTLTKNKGYSLINIGGLALGMAVAMLIGLWLHDELTFDSYFPNHDRIAQVWHHEVFNNEVGTQRGNPSVMAEEIRNVYGSDFKYVLQASWNDSHTLKYGDKMLSQRGNYMEPQVAEMLSLKMIHGARDGLKNMNAILLSGSVAKAYFNEDNPVGKIIRVDDHSDVQIVGVYEDIPDNTSFKNLKIILPWQLYLNNFPWVKKTSNPWENNNSQTFVQVADHVDMQEVSTKISLIMFNKVSEAGKHFEPLVFLHPMNKWHLYSAFKNRVNAGGQIDNVWLFGTTGVFVLVLACINFMNLTTARSEKRSREVGIRKSIGSARSQLITQFFSESVMIAVVAFLFALLIVALVLPMFNEIANKEIRILWSEPMFWLAGISFSVFTGLFAGLYPALFLSSFQPVKVLKGTFKTGQRASLPRKALVVAQFTISITLIIGTLVVYKQIDHAQRRPIGYRRDGLINVGLNEERQRHIDAIRTELKNEGTVAEMGQSGSPITDVWITNDSFDWDGKDPNQAVDFPNNAVSYDYGKTIRWEILQGRDFSRDFGADSMVFILNETAVRFVGLKDPIGKIIRWRGYPYTIVGVVKDLLVESPYNHVRPSFFHHSEKNVNVSLIRINPQISIHDALSKIETVFKKYNPSATFETSFVDDDFEQKFGDEKRISALATFFAVLAVIISCLGLFGLVSFVAEQRTKEIGIRKVMGASLANLWRMLSKDFVILVALSCLISIPLAYYYFSNWLLSYEYRTDIPWWIFATSCFGALVITSITVSFQAIKAALMNPVKSLKSE